jgi:hypothetical protein
MPCGECGSRHGSTSAPSSRARSSVASKAASTPGSMPSPVSSSGTPSRTPRRSVRCGRATGSGRPSAVESHGSGPAMARSSSAASVTSRVNGPAWSSEEAKAIIP